MPLGEIGDDDLEIRLVRHPPTPRIVPDQQASPAPRACPLPTRRMHGRAAPHGFEEQDLGELVVVVESQETVDREYGGSWFYALR